MLRLAFDFIITWRETRTRPNAYVEIFGFGFFRAAWKGGVPVKGLHLVARSG